MRSRVAVVTGGTRGLGRALSLQLGAAGYHVVALWHRDEGSADALQQDWKRLGQSGETLRWDLRSPGPVDLQIERGAEEVLLVHNAAAPFQLAPVHLLAEDDLLAQWEVAVLGFARCFASLARPMARAQKATVIGVGSRASLAATPPRGFAGYVAAKAGLQALIGGVASEYGERGVRAFMVLPGFMRTELTQAWDASIKAAVARSGESSPDATAQAILHMIQDPGVPGRGESHSV
jgi:3-oxoacyl-[acyl-carrier protein] reductase